MTHAEIKEEIRIVEAITAALGQEIEMANKLPGGSSWHHLANVGDPQRHGSLNDKIHDGIHDGIYRFLFF